MSLLGDYVDFVNRRQYVFYQKLTNPNYVDPILGEYKFTNVYRVLDRVSQYMLKNVIYSGKQDKLNIFFRVFIFNHFKTIAFWEYLKHKEIELTPDTFSPEEFISCLNDYKGARKLFTNAYMLPGKVNESKIVTTTNKISCLLKDINSNLKHIDEMESRELFNFLKKIPGVGDFLASQVVFDCLWHIAFKDLKPLYQLGIGAKRGAWKLGLVKSHLTKSEEEYKTAISKASEALMYNWSNLVVSNHNIYPHVADIQNTFCEVDKWFRVTHPEIILPGKKSTSRIKNKYIPSSEPVEYHIPGWWCGKNDIDLVSLHSPLL